MADVAVAVMSLLLLLLLLLQPVARDNQQCLVAEPLLKHWVCEKANLWGHDCSSGTA